MATYQLRSRGLPGPALFGSMAEFRKRHSPQGETRLGLDVEMAVIIAPTMAELVVPGPEGREWRRGDEKAGTAQTQYHRRHRQ